jgi:hypothetical protein
MDAQRLIPTLVHSDTRTSQCPPLVPSGSQRFYSNSIPNYSFDINNKVVKLRKKIKLECDTRKSEFDLSFKRKVVFQSRNSRLTE